MSEQNEQAAADAATVESMKCFGEAMSDLAADGKALAKMAQSASAATVGRMVCDQAEVVRLARLAAK